MAQPPAIVPSGILNAASKNPPDSPFGALARGSRFEISGVRFAEIANTINVSVAQSPKISVPLVSTSLRRIEAVMPEDAPLGRVSIAVNRGDQTSKQNFINVVRSNFGIFTENELGWGPAHGAGINFAKPSRPGAAVTISGTGLGDEAHPEVFVGGRRAVVLKVERKPLGIDEITFRVPQGGPEGCFVPVYAKSTKTRSPWVSNPATIPIAAAGSCVYPAYFPFAPVAPGEVEGIVAFMRQVEVDIMQGVATSDVGFAGFYKATGRGVAIIPMHLLPPSGTCTFAAGFFDLEAAASLSSLLTSANWSQLDPLDAGRVLRLQRPGLERLLPLREEFGGVYSGGLGNSGSSKRSLPLFLNPGPFTLSSEGGQSIGPFSSAIAAPTDFTWVNHAAVDAIDRKHGVRLEWKSLPSGFRMITFVSAANRDTRTAGTSICVAETGATSFLIPPLTLAGFPILPNETEGVFAYAGLAAIGPSPALLRAKGMDNAFAYSIALRFKRIRFR